MFQTIQIATEVLDKFTGIQIMGCKIAIVPKDLAEPPDFKDVWSKLHLKWRGSRKEEISNHVTVAAYRNFYREIGVNPNKTPPSMQNLIQRFLIHAELKRIPVIHPIVDAVNLAAVEHLLPLGIFDADTIDERIDLRFSRIGETFQPLGAKGIETLNREVLVLADKSKILSQFCYRDGELQKITDRTRTVWILGCQVPGINESKVKQALSTALCNIQQSYFCSKVV